MDAGNGTFKHFDTELEALKAAKAASGKHAIFKRLDEIEITDTRGVTSQFRIVKITRNTMRLLLLPKS